MALKIRTKRQKVPPLPSLESFLKIGTRRYCFVIYWRLWLGELEQYPNAERVSFSTLAKTVRTIIPTHHLVPVQ